MSVTELTWICLRGEQKGETPPHLKKQTHWSVLTAEGLLSVAKITLILSFYLLVIAFVLTTLFCVSRRNTSVDESYEWDSADACVDSEVLEATKLDQSHTGLQRGSRDQAGGLQDQRHKGDYFSYFSALCCIFPYE